MISPEWLRTAGRTTVTILAAIPLLLSVNVGEAALNVFVVTVAKNSPKRLAATSV